MGEKLGFNDDTLIATVVYTFARILIEKGVCTKDEIRRIAQEEQESEQRYLQQTYEVHRKSRRWWHFAKGR